MYISKIDDLIDKIIDDFYVNIILNNKNLINILKEPNFVKYQKDINTIISNYTDSINVIEIREFVKNSDAVHTIVETIKRYIAFYLFLTIGFHYNSKNDTFINNIVEYTKNQPEYGFKIDNFFNSESNALIIKYNIMIKNILILLYADKNKIDILKTKPDFREAIVFLNELNFDINKIFKLENLDNNKQTQAHNLIKTIIIVLLYKANEKKEFFRLLELTENLEGEYMFIDIVVPKQKYIDLYTIEKIIGTSPAVKNLSYYFWKFFTEREELLQRPAITNDEKIMFLLKSKIIYPICDDFLLYHKDSEKYDKTIDPSKIKKKEDTKIRYIVNKIDTTSEYYNDNVIKDEKLKNNIKKNFYIPLLHRKAILINNTEDMNIITKFINQGKHSIEHSEYLSDLYSYKIYPYINFKNFEKNGFNITLSETIDAVRFISLNKDTEFKQNSKHLLQTRVIAKDLPANIVGFIIPTNYRPFQCLKTKDVIDIRSLSKNKNGFNLIMNYLKESSLGQIKHTSSVYWLFDADIDNVPEGIGEYEQLNKYSTSEQIKHVVSAVYDSVINELYFIIINKLQKEKHLNLQLAYKIIHIITKSILKTNTHSILNAKLNEKIYELLEKTKDEYDKNEDIINGMSDDAIQLPTYPAPIKSIYQLLTINLSDAVHSNNVQDKEEIFDGLCQHNISWDKLASLQKSNPKLYTDTLYLFLQQYVTENVDGDFICKSCSHLINIKKYITDGEYDNDMQKFVTYSTPMEVPLEDVPEYEKYKMTIRNMEKIIDRIASVSNFSHLAKNASGIKWKRRAIIKDAIDILLINNSKLKTTHKERNEFATKNYNISRDLSDLFVFELDNSIFVFSSKDKDQYKPIKQNNILAYIIFLIILDINDSHVPFIGGDKKGLCNFSVFEKVLYPLFGGLKIRINNKGDFVDITKYKILCYIIYMTGCSIIRYSMWHYDYPDPTKKSKYIPVIQKIFINTLIDIINSILEIASQQGIHYLYESISIKLFKKLQSTFSNDELYNRLKNDYKTSTIGEKKNFIITKNKTTELSGKFQEMSFDIPYRLVCRSERFMIKQKYIPITRYNTVNNVTNCENGEFHLWALSDKNFKCKSCNSISSNIKYDDKESDKIKHNLKYVILHNLSNKYCIHDGDFHVFHINDKHEKLCIKCNNSDTYNYTNKELDKLDIVINKFKISQSLKLFDYNHSIQHEINTNVTYIDKVINNLSLSFKEHNKDSHLTFINLLLNELQNIIGNDIDTHTNTHLSENSYIIDHDHFGTKLDKNVVITDSNNKIFYKQNHSFYKTDVIYYTTYKNGKTEIFYDAKTHILLGYKEESKNFILDKKSDRKIIINYSILNKFKMMGYSSQFIDISNEYDDLLKYYKKESIPKIIIENIIRNRINNLKTIIYEFQRILFRILNNFNNTPIDHNNDNEYFSNKLNIFIEKYKKTISTIKITDSKNNHAVFKHWKGVSRGIFCDTLHNIKYTFDDHKTINYEDINKLDNNGNMILFFIIEEFIKLLKYNSSKFVKLSISNFIIEFINTVFELFNMEKHFNNIEIKRFNYILNSSTFIQEISDKTGTNLLNGIYDEQIDSDEEISDENKEEKIDDEEEADALDVEFQDDGDFESGYDRASEWIADNN